MIKLAPSILAADFSKLGEQIDAIKEAEYVHIDVMDGQFVPNISFGMPVMSSIRKLTKQVFDVHLMIEEPARFLDDFKAAGADLICVHQEACKHLDSTIQQIKQRGLKAAVALNPATSVETLRNVLSQLDMVLIMSVNPGFGGQSFIPYSLDKIKAVRAMANEMGLPELDIEVDGGVGLDNVQEVLDAGANVIVAGSAVFKNDPSANVKEFHKIFEQNK